MQKMTEEELFLAVKDCTEKQDIGGAYDLADLFTDEHWRSEAHKLVVDMTLAMHYRLGESAASLAYSIASILITDLTWRTECMLRIADVAAEYQDWDTVKRASHSAVVGVFIPPPQCRGLTVDTKAHHVGPKK